MNLTDPDTPVMARVQLIGIVLDRALVWAEGYTEFAEHDDAPDSAATVCRHFFEYGW